jgi:hypothetical protein
MKYQKGFIPIPIFIALAISALLGAYIGYQLGDGMFFSLGVGFGVVFIAYKIYNKYISDEK